MNQIYKVIWSRVKHCYVVVSEVAGRCGKNGGAASEKESLPIRAFLCALALTGCLMPGVAEANTQYGPGASATGGDSVAVGDSAKATAGHATAIGTLTEADGTNSFVAGLQAKSGATAENSVAIGRGAQALGQKRVSEQFTASTIAIGNNATATENGDIVIGRQAKSTVSQYHNHPQGGNGAVVMGAEAASYGSRGDVVLGAGAEACLLRKDVTNPADKSEYSQGVAIGSRAKVYGTQSTSIGADSRSIGHSSIAIGGDDIDKAKPVLTAAIPDMATTGVQKNFNRELAVLYPGTTLGSAAINDSKNYVNTASIGNASMAIGMMTQSYGTGSTAIGVNTLTKGIASTGIGVMARSWGDKSLALGSRAETYGNKSTAVGDANTVGFDMTDGTTSGTASSAVGTDNKVYGNNSYAIGGGNTIGSATITETTEANGDKIKKVTAGTVKGSTAGAFGYKNTVTTDNAYVVGNNSTASADGAMVLGSSASVTGKNGVALGNNTKVANENAVAIGNGSETAAAVATPSATINGVAHNFAGVNPASTVSVGKAGAERTITNVAAGRISATSTDAINGSQLYAVTSEIDKGVAYAGDVKAAAAAANKFTRKLGEQTNIVGGVTDTSKLTDGNIGVVSNGTDTLNIKLAKNVKVDSVTTGNTVINNNGLTVGGKTYVTNNGLNANNQTITNVASGGTTDSNAANIGDVKTAVTNVTNALTAKGLDFEGNDGVANKVHRDLGTKLTVKGGLADVTTGVSGKNLGVKKNAAGDGLDLVMSEKPEFKEVTAGTGTNKVVINDNGVHVGGKTYINNSGLNANNQKITNVATGTAGTDAVNVDQLNAAIGGTAKATTVKAKDANVTVTKGTSAETGGREYTIGLGNVVTVGQTHPVTVNGDAGTVNGLTNTTWDIDNPQPVSGQAATEDQLKTVSDGVKTNKTNITNINNTIAKGLNFGGDSGADINKKLGEKLEIKGGASADLTDGNIGVVSDGTKLNVKLKKDVNLGPDGSLTINGKTYVNKDGLNANGQKITNVADGTVNSDAVNFGQLKDAVAAGKTILKDGKNTTVEGEGTVANPYKVNVNDDLVLGKKGADGKDGSIGVNGKDGSSVVIHGKDGISIKGKDGKDGVTLKAKDGANGTEGQIGLTGPAGKDGRSTHADIGVNAGPASLDPAKNLSATEMTRLYYVDEKGDHQVATMDDGMKFAGNTGLAIKKLNSTMTIRGTGTKADTEYDPSNIKTMVDADGNMIVGLDKNLKADSVGINGKDGRDGATIKGGDGKPGVDGTNITRLIIEEKNGKQHDIATLDDGMKYGGDTGAVIKKKLNGQVNVIGGISDESKLTTDDNIGVVSDGSNNLKARLAKDLKGLNSVTAGNVVMDTTGFYVKQTTRAPAGTGTVSLTADGLNNGGNKIANIAAGEADTDAVNVSQLKNQGSEIVNKGFGIKAEDGNEVKKKLGETVDVVGDGKNISTRVEGGRVRVGLKDDILLNSVTTGRTRMDTNGLTVQDGSGNTAVTVDKDGLKIKDGPSVTKSGIDAGGKKITNVAAGEADTDAVNVSQLKKAAAGATTKVADGKNTTVTSETNADGSKTYHVNLNDDITLGTDPSKQISIKGTEGTIKAGQVTVNGTAGTVNGLTNKTWDPNNITSGQAATEDQLKVVSGQAGKHSSVTAGSNISVTTGTNANGGTDYKVSVVDTPTFKTVTTGNTVMSNSGLTIKNGPSITQTGVDAGGKRITNVAAGKADTDAVNVGQLKQIGGAINKVDNRINRVGAGAAALAALHPLDFDPDDKWDFTLGYGNYKDAHSLALGAFYRPNEDTMISVGGSIGGGENMVNAGLSMKLGQGNHVSTSKVAMAKEIKDLRAELENVKGALLKVADGRPLDSMDMDKMQLFPDVPENHWAYDYVATLAGNGVIVGYPDGQFGGDRMMTRYEMAALIYRAMQNGAAADDRMARALKEFEPELERIRVDTISKHKDGTPDIQRVRVIKGRG